ncbi:AraC family transcriptional regulator [Arenicella chitinivorans]|uniref:AraC family transcriptional regulator n=1 Tax=Arenicella chitinivorans TaxID=1329800 RepID=A0A918S1G2_9GAMM|nr:helix-turn-helix domain-containing protein [Arenicella chitinivorans]GHA20123.1 AraC family transcriptional regulator [Arenicella chitinivorans]
MSTALIIALTFASSQVMLSLAVLLTAVKHWRLPHAILFCFLLAVLAYIAHPMVSEHWVGDWVLPLENAIPGLFWLLCSSLFNERFRLAPWNLMLVLSTVLIPQIGILAVDYLDIGLPYFLYRTMPQALEFVLLAWALYVVVRSWRDDLVESRRDLRLVFSAIAGGYIFTLISMREIFMADSPWLDQWQYLPVGAICLITNLLLLQYKPGVIAEDTPEETQTGSNAMPARLRPVDEVEVPVEVVQQLDSLMKQEHLYREMGLTIGQLADRMAMPEYRLRKIINAGLGYRNFNDYLNRFRIAEAGDKLADPAYENQAVLSIALDTGFRSLSSFNKAFRDAYRLTPTAYRQHKLGSE